MGRSLARIYSGVFAPESKLLIDGYPLPLLARTRLRASDAFLWHHLLFRTEHVS
jgi:hypothetical protein